MTFLEDTSLIQEKKQPVPPTRGMDSTGWKNGWLQLAVLGNSACTIGTAVGRMGARTLDPDRLAVLQLLLDLLGKMVRPNLPGHF
ncbi:hypothetical protein [uncultured Desulfosarcina sp.]|uniref:hypothetical protein n=1 Tax=uncultured Desulfosarcina sp. TaxID=218289 RepID=UPI0029C63E5D|nr:hypothetical protein [uncultured Desulfosarcina sp.]